MNQPKSGIASFKTRFKRRTLATVSGSNGSSAASTSGASTTSSADDAGSLLDRAARIVANEESLKLASEAGRKVTEESLRAEAALRLELANQHKKVAALRIERDNQHKKVAALRIERDNLLKKQEELGDGTGG